MNQLFRLSCPQQLIRICSGKSVSFMSTDANVHNILSTHLGISHEAIENAIRSKHKIISKISEKRLIRNCEYLKKFNVNFEEVRLLLNCLSLKPCSLCYRISLLDEMGVKNIRLYNIYKFPTSFKQPLSEFKKIHDIPPQQDVIRNIFVRVGLSTKDIPEIKNLCSSELARDYYKACMTYYKSYNLNLCYKELIETKRVYHSFRQLSRLLDLYENTFQFDKKFLMSHRYLMNLYPDEITYVLNNLKEFKIGKLDLLKIIKTAPFILGREPENVKELLAYFEENNITDSIPSCIRILCIPKKVFVERYNFIQNIPELNIWAKHPRIMRLIYHWRATKQRIEYLRDKNCMSHVNIHTLVSTNQFFKRFMDGNTSHVSCKKYLEYILCKELGTENAYIMKYVIRHCHWKNISLYSVNRTVVYLKQHYSVEDICQNIHIVLYPQFAIANTLEKVYEEFPAGKRYSFTPSQYLALCLYTLEKVTHFNGDAVWQVMHHQEPMFNFRISNDLNQNEFERFDSRIHSDDKLMYDVSEETWINN